MNQLFIINLMIISTLFGAFGSLNLKLGSKNVNNEIISYISNKKLILGIFLYGLSTLIYLHLLKKNDLNLLYPLTALTYVWVILISKFLLKEKINKTKIISIILIVIGIILIMLW